MADRVIQWGTGNVGRHSLRTILGCPGLALVGLRVYNPDKVGVDAGTIVGVADTGIRATDDVDAILELDADCVNYNALGATEDSFGAVIDDLETLLRAGFNVTSSAPESLVYPKAAPADVVARLERACAAGREHPVRLGCEPGVHHGRLADLDDALVARDRAHPRHRGPRHGRVHLAERDVLHGLRTTTRRAGVGEFWSMEIEGDPSMKLTLEARTRLDSGRVVSLFLASDMSCSVTGQMLSANNGQWVEGNQ